MGRCGQSKFARTTFNVWLKVDDVGVGEIEMKDKEKKNGWSDMNPAIKVLLYIISTVAGFAIYLFIRSLTG